MNSKERMLKTLYGECVSPIPVTPHWWGVEKFQLAGIIHGPENEAAGWALSGRELAQVDSFFFETFHPDMFHLSTGAWKPQPGDADRLQARNKLRPAVMELASKQAIDDYVAATTPSEQEITDSGIYNHIPLLIEKYGNDVLIMLNEGNPVCEVFENGGPAGDFQDALIATLEHPDNLAYLIWKLYEAKLTWMRVLQRSGVHGYIGSETCVSPDILSPKAFRSIVFPALKSFYTEIDRMGLIPITYFLGDILPIVPEIVVLGVRALMIEEPKKGYKLDMVEIYKALDGKVALFGNLDSVFHLLLGDVASVETETRRQCSAAQNGAFIMACGSPLCFNTPKENIMAMIHTARSYPG